MDDQEVMPIQYRFDLADGTTEIFDLQVDLGNVELITNLTDMPSWTRLDFHQCPNCPFSPDVMEHCPVATNFSPFVAPFEKLLSFDQVTITVTLPERQVSQKTSVQSALSSLLGLAFAASACPHTSFLKPMARFHQPMISEEETIFRMTSTYMLAQYLRIKTGLEPDFDMQGLIKLISEIQVLNSAMAKRLRAASKTDSPVNAIIQLDMYAKALPYAIEESLNEIGSLFAGFLKN